MTLSNELILASGSEVRRRLLTEADVDPTAVAREKEIFSDQARQSGKPENIIEKMVEGRLRKFFEEVVLLKQAFVMNPDLTVEKALVEAEKEIGQVVEGVKAARAVEEVATELGIEMPICHQVYRILYDGVDPREAVGNLMRRQIGPELD